MILRVLAGFIRAAAFFVIGLPVTALGLLVVPVALLFRVPHPSTTQAFTDPRQVPGYWMLVTLRNWARWWSNEFDGALGDKRGWWNTYCLKVFKRECTSFLCMFWWLAIRNPANYWSRVVTGVDVSRCVILHLAGAAVVDEDHPGWQVLAAVRDDGKVFPYFTWVAPWGFKPDHCAYVRIGWKINLDHNNVLSTDRIQDRLKGSVFRGSPWKAI